MEGELPLNLPPASPPDDLDRYAASLTKPDKRPSYSADIVLRTAMRALLPHVLKWLGDEAKPHEHDEIMTELIEAACRSYDDDGFTFAKELDRKGWSVNAELVEILDTFGMYHSRAYDRMIKGWVKAHRITLDIPVGARVAVNKGEGEVTAHYTETARYLVCIESAGHVKNGEGVHGFVVNKEDVRIVHPS